MQANRKQAQAFLASMADDLDMPESKAAQPVEEV